MSMSKGFARWNSFQARLNHAFARGFLMDLNYTFAKELDVTNNMEDALLGNPGGSLGGSGLDIKNLNNNIKLGGSDLKHRANAIFVYELPFGTGKALNVKNRVVNHLISGWQTGSTVTIQSGFPIVISGATDDHDR